jgi:signal peptidase II
MRIKRGGLIVVMVAVVATIGCDRVTKHAATTMLAGQPDHSYLADTVRLGYVENSGGFLSLGASWPSAVRTMFFTVATGLTLLALAVVAVRGRKDRWSSLGFALFLAGGFSNWVDRIARGSVVDFLNVGVGPVRTGVFNVADVAIMLGAAVFALAEFRRSRGVSV